MNLEINLASSQDVDENFVFITNLDNEPRTFKQAISNASKDSWISSMQEEIKELEAQNTWELVNLPPGRVALGGRWVYKLKKDS
jgi:hypothetical protein